MTASFTSLKGHLLLDSGALTGSFFHRTVVLICQHDSEGAFGLVLNKSSDNRVSELLVANLPGAIKSLPVSLGGPVQPATMSFLHSDAVLLQANVMPNLSMGNSIDALAELGESFLPAQRLRVFAGYSGWGPGQLEDEMKRRAWLTHPASIDLVFPDEPPALWRRILHLKGGQYRLLAESPDDLSWN